MYVCTPKILGISKKEQNHSIPSVSSLINQGLHNVKFKVRIDYRWQHNNPEWDSNIDPEWDSNIDVGIWKSDMDD